MGCIGRLGHVGQSDVGQGLGGQRWGWWGSDCQNFQCVQYDLESSVDGVKGVLVVVIVGCQHPDVVPTLLFTLSSLSPALQ